MAEKALVTGATGFVGAAVARALVAEGFAVRVLARQHSPRTNLDGLAVEVAEGDLTDPASLRRAAAGCTAVFHVAADYRLWTRDPAAMFRVNVEGSRAVVLAAMEAGARRIVYTSSVATLGLPPGGTPGDETTPVAFADMIGPYKQSKFKAEEEVRRLIAQENAPVVIVNPSTPIGPGDVRPTPTGRMIVEAARGRMPAFVDTGLNVVHVDDVAAGHVLALRQGRIGERYVLGGENMELGEILAGIARLTGRRPPRFRIPHGAVLPLAVLAEAWARLIPSAGEPFVTVDGIKMARKKMFFSSAKAARELGYASRPAPQALADAVAWFRRHGYLR
ncbi:MAG: hopanoid-associated sugar epimerase [Pseudomonadota bacterium]